MSNVNMGYVAERASSLTNPVTTAVVFKRVSDSTKATFVKIPGSSIVNGRAFRVRASGRATTAGAYTFAATIQYTADVTNVNAATAANNTDAVALTARSISTATRAWMIDAVFIWDSTSQRLTGQKNGLNSETIETASAAITALTSVDLSLETAGFVVNAIFGTTNASNICYLDYFALEVL
jgi:hypothetical protein